jgi:CRP/FNR family transcriptional regulator, cyclic AMP receptor protein
MIIFSQGDTADAVFYIQKGKVKVYHIRAGQGGGCRAPWRGRLLRRGLPDCVITRFDKAAVVRVLHDEPEFSEKFIAHLLVRNARVEEDLADQLFNSSEKRLARVLLLIANFGKEGKTEPVIGKISQDTLAEIVGTTRSRVSVFINKFRKLGFIEYNGDLKVHNSLLNVVLHDAAGRPSHPPRIAGAAPAL